MKSEVQLHLFHSTCTCCWLLSNVKSQLLEVKDPSPIVDCLWGIIYQQLVSHFKFSIPCTFTFDEESGWNISDTDLPEVVLPNLTQLTNQDRKLQKSSIFPAFCIAQRDSLVKAKVPGKLYSAPFPWGETRKVPLQSFNFTLLLKTWWIMQYELELGRNLLSLTVAMHMRCWDIKLVSWDIFSRSTNTKAHGFL